MHIERQGFNAASTWTRMNIEIKLNITYIQQLALLELKIPASWWNSRAKFR